ncbi:MAG: hypothetical protein IPI69_10375 [Bacteroidales bacterium]|nr:hypothetical protein [Bacteroidales bacterium]
MREEEDKGEKRRMGEGGNKKSTGRRGRSSGHRARGQVLQVVQAEK